MNLEIIDPTGIVYNGEAEKITIPGILGILGILEGHTKLITPLQSGVITIKGEAGDTYYQVDSGYAHICPNKCQILSLESIQDLSQTKKN